MAKSKPTPQAEAPTSGKAETPKRGAGMTGVSAADDKTGVSAAEGITAPRKLGRPKGAGAIWPYDPEIADIILAGLATGRPLAKICQDEGIPPVSAVLRWLDNPVFSEGYARARATSADALADEIVAISDDQTLDPAARRVMVDARKWIAAKLKPQSYGDSLKVDQTVSVETQTLAQMLDSIRPRPPAIDITPNLVRLDHSPADETE